MNAKKPPRKVSNLMKMMNYMLYSVFALQFFIIILYASLSISWIAKKGENYEYLNLDNGSAKGGHWFIQLLTYWVAYSHMIPISLYVMIEVLKLTQATLIRWDKDIGEDGTEDKPAECKNSDLIEELGQIDFIFSDKTGTLTCNQMIFRKCSVNGKKYESRPDEIEDNKSKGHASDVNMNQSEDSRYVDKEEKLYWEDEAESDKDVLKFFEHMTICHSVMVEKPSTKLKNGINKDSENDKENLDPIYQCASPDELALVKAASIVGITLTGRSKEYITVEKFGHDREYKM